MEELDFDELEHRIDQRILSVSTTRDKARTNLPSADLSFDSPPFTKYMTNAFKPHLGNVPRLV